jgi:AraC-like DNA-binding protein
MKLVKWSGFQKRFINPHVLYHFISFGANRHCREPCCNLGVMQKGLQLSRDLILASLDKPLTLADFAYEACLSPYHFHRCFVQQFGLTPQAYRTNLRLKEARRLLAADHLSVSEICLKIGYSSLGSFSTLFVDRFGMSPLQFRQSVRRHYQLTGYRGHLFVPACFFWSGSRVPGSTCTRSKATETSL